MGIRGNDAIDKKDSTVDLIAKRARLEMARAECKAIYAKLEIAYRQAIKRSINSAARFDKLKASCAQKQHDIRQHAKFVGQLAAQVFDLKHEVEDLAVDQSPGYIEVLVAGTFKCWELKRSGRQLIEMRHRSIREENRLDELEVIAATARANKEIYPTYCKASKSFIGILQKAVDAVVKEIAQRKSKKGSKERGKKEIGEQAAEDSEKKGAEKGSEVEKGEKSAKEEVYVEETSKSGENEPQQQAPKQSRQAERLPGFSIWPTWQVIRLKEWAETDDWWRRETARRTRRARSGVAAGLARDYASRWRRVKKVW